MNRGSDFEGAACAVREADALLIAAGAGIGVDSGLPDFRGNEGFWKAYPPIARLGLSFPQMANPEWFDRDPVLAWAFYGHRLGLYRGTPPHAGFRLLLELGQSKPEGYFVFTSNVDGHFQKAGFDSERIQECHRSIHFLQCTRPCGAAIWGADDCRVEVDMEEFRAREPLPRCPGCSAPARPNILMFGDWSWLPRRTEEQGRRLFRWLHEIGSKGARLAVVEIGAGVAVPTVRHFAESTASGHSGTLIRINPQESGTSRAGGYSLAVGALEGIRRLCGAALPGR